MELTIYVDGGARGNPGPAGAGVVILTATGEPVHEAAYFLGSQTNNFAEYVALIRALERAARTGPKSITIHSDSELLVRQITGDYQVKAANLRPLFEQVQVLLLKVPRWQIRHVRREQNRRADELANLAMDEKRDVIVFDVDGAASSAASPSSVAAEPAPVAELPPEREPWRAEAPERKGRLTIQLVPVTPPSPNACPSASAQGVTRLIDATLPEGLCTYAAQAILPTVIAMLGTDPAEMRGIPTLTVRCSKRGCGAVFTMTAVMDENGASQRH